MTSPQAKFNKALYHRRRAEGIEYLGGRCSKCGETENLHFHHINPEEKEFNLTGAVSEERWWTELKKCELLCYLCHLRGHVEPGVVKQNVVHGRRSSYTKYGCRCDLCREANWLYGIERRDAIQKRKTEKIYVCSTPQDRQKVE